MKKNKNKDLEELTKLIAEWIDIADYDNVYYKIPGMWSRGKAETIVKLIKKEFKLKP